MYFNDYSLATGHYLLKSKKLLCRQKRNKTKSVLLVLLEHLKTYTKMRVIKRTDWKSWRKHTKQKQINSTRYRAIV